MGTDGTIKVQAREVRAPHRAVEFHPARAGARREVASALEPAPAVAEIPAAEARAAAEILLAAEARVEAGIRVVAQRTQAAARPLPAEDRILAAAQIRIPAPILEVAPIRAAARIPEVAPTRAAARIPEVGLILAAERIPEAAPIQGVVATAVVAMVAAGTAVVVTAVVVTAAAEIMAVAAEIMAVAAEMAMAAAATAATNADPRQAETTRGANCAPFLLLPPDRPQAAKDRRSLPQSSRREVYRPHSSGEGRSKRFHLKPRFGRLCQRLRRGLRREPPERCVPRSPAANRL
jgi:hypothetical protein